MGFLGKSRFEGKATLIVPGICALLIVTFFASYTLGFETGSDEGYEKGYIEGRTLGNHTGFEAGYHLGSSAGYTNGFEAGNVTGYSVGYELGFRNGNADGYRIGLENGNTTGYSLGYNVGFKDGNITGYGIGYITGNITGYSAGYNEGYTQGVIDGAGRGVTIRDPTYREMLKFIAEDQTDKNDYIPEKYVCFHFTADLKLNAFKAGYKCGFVYIRFPDSAHAIVCFNTTDHGLIFIEPQTDDVVTLDVGKPYWDRARYTVSYDDTVISYVIIW